MKMVKNTNKYFTAVFEKNEKKGYTVTVPSLPGLVTEGKNFEDAIRMVKDAIRCYIDGFKKPSKKIVNKIEIGRFEVAIPA